MTLSTIPDGHLYGQVAEVIPNQLYFASFEDIPKDDQQRQYMRVADYVHYDSFYDDFGPLNLSVLYRFCEEVNRILKVGIGVKLPYPKISLFDEFSASRAGSDTQYGFAYRWFDFAQAQYHFAHF